MSELFTLYDSSNNSFSGKEKAISQLLELEFESIISFSFKNQSIWNVPNGSTTSQVFYPRSRA